MKYAIWFIKENGHDIPNEIFSNFSENGVGYVFASNVQETSRLYVRHQYGDKVTNICMLCAIRQKRYEIFHFEKNYCINYRRCRTLKIEKNKLRNKVSTIWTDTPPEDKMDWLIKHLSFSLLVFKLKIN